MCVFSRKHYIDLKRREDGFDLSGPFSPQLDHPPIKAVLLVFFVISGRFLTAISNDFLNHILSHGRRQAGNIGNAPKWKNCVEK